MSTIAVAHKHSPPAAPPSPALSQPARLLPTGALTRIVLLQQLRRRVHLQSPLKLVATGPKSPGRRARHPATAQLSVATTLSTTAQSISSSTALRPGKSQSASLPTATRTRLIQLATPTRARTPVRQLPLGMHLHVSHRSPLFKLPVSLMVRPLTPLRVAGPSGWTGMGLSARIKSTTPQVQAPQPATRSQ